MITVIALTEQSSDYKPAVQAMSDIEAVVHREAAWTYQVVIELLEQDSVYLLLALDDVTRQVVGYCLYQSLFEQSEILRIGTHPDFQRQGVASALFVELHKTVQASNAQNLLLEVRADNAPAIALYERQGFQEIHRRRGYYHVQGAPAVDAVIMQLTYSGVSSM